MKKFLIAILLLLNLNGKAQITLEHVLDSTSFPRFYCTDIGNNDFKYISLNTATNSFDIFNMDMTPYLTNIQIPVTDSIYQGFWVTYVTKSLFDCDSNNIEYVYQNSINGSNNPFRIFRTDGTLLFQVDSANGPFYYAGLLGGSLDIRPIINTSAGTKLFLQKYDNNGVAEVLIYGLCGVLPLQIFDFSSYGNYVKIFPNPTATELNFEILLPNNEEQFEMIVTDINGKEQNRVNVTFCNGKYSLDAKRMSSGTYMYSLISKTKVYQSGRFVLTK